MFGRDAALSAAGPAPDKYLGGLPNLPHFAPKAKRAVYMHMLGGPPQQDLFDYKPGLKDWYDKDLPDSVRQGQRLTTMSSGQARFPIAPSIYKFSQHGQSGAWVSELLPHTAKMVDDIAIVKSLYTEQINHEPAITYIQTGSMIGGRPCIGSWLAYGLGNMSEDLPDVRRHERGSLATLRTPIQAMSARMWSAGFLPAKYSGVSLRAGAEPVLFINNPDGVSPAVRRRMLDAVSELNQLQHQAIGDPETLTRIAQYEMAYRMQASVPELTDLSAEPASVYDLYGEDARRAGKLRAVLPDDAASARARDAVRADLAERLGRAFQRHRPSAESVPGRRPGVLRLRAGPEAARHARRHAARLGRRVRPHDLLARAS